MSDTQQFIFGYGSFLESRSRVMTSPSALYASPVNVVGIQRGWFGRVVSASLSPTYLGAISDPNFNCNGVIFKVSQQELEALDNHESGYKRERLDQKNIAMLDGSKSAPEGDIWFYAVTEKRFASPEFPIVQSYVDICLNGCLEIEAAYPLTKEAGFAEMFLRTSRTKSARLPRPIMPASPNAFRNSAGMRVADSSAAYGVSPASTRFFNSRRSVKP